MNLLPFILKSLYRSRRRTFLTGSGIAVAVFVISSLLALEAGFTTLIGSAEASVVNVYEKGVACVVLSRVFDSYLERIKSLPHVTEATGVLRGVFSYQSKDKPVMVAGIDLPRFQSIKNMRFKDGGVSDFNTRTDGALVGRRLAVTFGWKAGQTVSLLENGLTFTISGVFECPDQTYEGMVLLQKDYLAKLSREEGKSTVLLVQINDPNEVASVSRSIDQVFGNYPKPTKSQSERDAKAAELRDYRELRRMLALLLMATTLVSIFGAANSVSMSVRERSREVGVLRAIGLRKGAIFGILAGEAVAVALAGGAAGLALSSALLLSAGSLKGLIPLVVSPATVSAGLGIAALIGLGGAIIPSIGATRVHIIESLRLVD
ncbi:MAG: ABC transporter permease [Acidobacteria bacterium]|nr:ABC transporter permease [Acidobacteriota bacterium]